MVLRNSFLDSGLRRKDAKKSKNTESVEQLAGGFQEAGGGGFVLVALGQRPGRDLTGDSIEREFFGREVEAQGDSVRAWRSMAGVGLRQAQVLWPDQVAVGDNGSIFKQVAQFPNVVGPVVPHHQIEGRLGEARQMLALVLPEMVKKMVYRQEFQVP